MEPEKTSKIAGSLSADDIGTLQRAEALQHRFDAGIFPRGAGQHRHFAKLVRLGFLEFYAWGRDIDGEVEQDVAVHRLTDAGHAALTRINTSAIPAAPRRVAPGGG